MRRKEIALRIAAVRAETRLSQRAMAEQIGVSTTAWQALEYGKNVPSGETLLKISELGYSPSWILTGEGEMRAGMATPASLRAVNPVVLGKIASKIEDMFKDLGQNPTKADVTEIAADIYNKMLAAETDFNDPDQLNPAIAFHIAKLRSRIPKSENPPRAAVA